MEKQTLPNSTLVLIFGILSILGCCCYGILGLIFGIIAIVLANRAIEVYTENPELYSGYQNVKTGKILAIIGTVLCAIFILIIIVILSLYDSQEILEMQREWSQQYGTGM